MNSNENNLNYISRKYIGNVVKNYIINELGFSKEYLEKIIDTHLQKIVENEIKQRLVNTNYLDNFIQKTVVNFMAEPVPVTYSVYTNTFKEWIKNKMYKAIYDTIQENFDINIVQKQK